MAINKSNIQSREQGDASMMPVGLLSTVSDQDVIDLIAYPAAARRY